MDTGKVKDWLLIGAVLGGAYALYKAFNVVASVPAVLRTAGEAVGSGLYDWLHPDQLGETQQHIVRFPDGSKHSVPSRSVDSAGSFVNRNLSPSYAGDGKRYQLIVEKATGQYVALPA